MCCLHGYGSGSSDGLQGQLVGAEVQTGIQDSVAGEVISPSDVHHGIQCPKFCFFFFVQLSVFPGVDKHLISLFAMLAMSSSPILPQTLQQNCETPHSAANKPNNLSATFLLNQWESAPLLATKNRDWEREW